MKPIEFIGQNKVYAKDQKQYLPLPVLEMDGMCISCWKLMFKERIQILLFGKIWLSQMNFNKPLQPQCPSVDKPFIVGE